LVTGWLRTTGRPPGRIVGAVVWLRRIGFGSGRDPRGWLGALLLVTALVAVMASVVDLRFAVVAVIASLLAGRWMGRITPALAGFAVIVLVGAIMAIMAPYSINVGTAAVAVFAGMVPWLIGLAWRQSAALVRAGWDRVEHLEREQRLVADQARLRERACIAQDMHDVLGHELNLIALRAGALKLAPGLDERHRDAAGELRAGAAAAVERLGEVVGVLRETAGDRPMEPAETGLSALVERTASSGVEVRLSVDGASPAASMMHDHAVHRVVQEALTNVMKHAPGSAVNVQVRYGAAETVLEVVNRPVPVSPGVRPAGGLGLVGLHERVRLAGGTFEAGPRGDSWAVVARLPHASETVPALPASPAVEQRRRARHRVNRAVLALVLLPLSTFALLYAALWAWTDHVISQAVLDPDGYASLRVGQHRAEIAPLLPRRQAPNPPPGAVSPGATCEHYAITRDRFDSRSGDVYRLCFRDGVLTSMDILTG
jgi:signal transduction histidine kinase